MAFSGYKNQRRRTGTRLERGRGENKQTFIPLFLLKETEEATSSGGRKQLAHQSSITSPFPCLHRGSNTGNTTRRKNRNCTEGSKFSAPVSSLRNRGVRASRSWGTNAWRKAILWLYKQEKATEKEEKLRRNMKKRGQNRWTRRTNTDGRGRAGKTTSRGTNRNKKEEDDRTRKAKTEE